MDIALEAEYRGWVSRGLMTRVAPGPIDVQKTAETIAARVTTPGDRPRVHGYDVEGDLARHYGLHESVFLALTGELPSDGVGRALEVAAMFAAPATIAEAPVHAAALVMLCGAQPKSVVAAGAVALAEESQHVMDAHAPFLAWLDAPGDEVPEVARGGDLDRGAVGRLVEALSGVPLTIPALERQITRTAAVLAVLHACGLRQPAALVAFWTWARLPFAAAEALSGKAGAFRDYPVRLPPFVYEEGER